MSVAISPDVYEGEAPFRRLVARSVLLPILLLVLLTAALTGEVSYLLSANRHLAQSDQVISSLQQLQIHLNQMEIAQNQNAISRTSESLARYEEAGGSVDQTLANLQDAVPDDPALRAGVEALRDDLSQWRALTGSAGYKPGDDQAVMDGMAARINQLEAPEILNRDQHSAAARQAATIVLAANGLGVVGLVVVLMFLTPRQIVGAAKIYNQAVRSALGAHQEALAELKASEERFRSMADSTPVLVWMSDVAGKCTWQNRSRLEFVGRPMQDELGDGWINSIHPEDRQRCLDIYHAHFQKREPFTMEYRLRRHDGVYRWVLYNGVPLYGASGVFSGCIGSCIDITDRKRHEEERAQVMDAERAARAAAERANRIKDEFLSTLSHELRTPLSAILGWTQILRTGNVDEGDLAQGLETIERNARAQTRLVEDLLDMSRLGSGKIRLEIGQVDLGDVAQAAVDAVGPTMHAKEIRFQKHVDPAANLVRGDRGRLQQVVWILLSNAIKFTPRHGTIELHVERAGAHVQLRVVDDGLGIKPDFLPHIFEPFRQADASSTRKFGGMGLSLALVKQLVELHGGTVAVDSGGENKGSTFTVSLPVATFTHDQWPLVNRDLATGSLPVIPLSLEGLKVLIVDDESDARDLLRRVLGDCHAHVFSAESANEGMEILRREMPDVLISDLGLPEKDGLEFIREIRALPAAQGGTIPALALTAFARSEDRAHAMIAGYQLHVAKPVEPNELIANVASLGRRHGAQE